jgi:hypothetical protein
VNAKVKRYDVAIKEMARAARLAGDEEAANDLERRYKREGFEIGSAALLRDQLEITLRGSAARLRVAHGPRSLDVNVGDRDAAFVWLREVLGSSDSPGCSTCVQIPHSTRCGTTRAFDALVKKVGAPWAR